MTRGLLVAIAGIALPLAAQTGTDIYLIPLTRTATSVEAGAPINITARPGYDNQPSFSLDGKSVYFASQRDGQTDIYRYDIASKATVQITRTPESEYSPIVEPEGRHLATVRVMMDSSQRLWRFGLDGHDEGAEVNAIRQVGYHAWLDSSTAFVFVLGNPNTLRRVDVMTGNAQVLAENIGRTILQVPGKAQTISFAYRDSLGWSVMAVDATKSIQTITRLPSRNEYFAWTPEGEILAAIGNRVVRWRAAAAVWEDVGTFADPGLQQITRLAVSPDGKWLAVVGNEPRP